MKSSKRFDANEDCDARSYKYLLPKYALVPINEFPGTLQTEFPHVQTRTTGANLTLETSIEALKSVSEQLAGLEISSGHIESV